MSESQHARIPPQGAEAEFGFEKAGQTSEDARNPPWNRDELILALDAYLRWKGNPPAKGIGKLTAPGARAGVGRG
jgi:hypothetical protein